MKIIFTETIKGKGNKNEVKDLANGYANFLIKEGKAIVANEENLSNLKIKLEKEAEEEQIKLNLADANKRMLEKLPPIKFYQPALPDGSAKKSITKKDVEEKLVNLLLDNNNQPFENIVQEIKMKPIKHFGLFDIEVKLYKNIKAIIKVQILIL